MQTLAKEPILKQNILTELSYYMLNKTSLFSSYLKPFEPINEIKTKTYIVI